MFKSRYEKTIETQIALDTVRKAYAKTLTEAFTYEREIERLNQMKKDAILFRAEKEALNGR